MSLTTPTPPPLLEFHLLGTGTSSSVPSIHCLTSPTEGCHCCRSTLNAKEGTDEARNVRRNTSGLLRVPPRVGQELWRTVLCGKTFYAAALEHWPKHHLRQIDALLITHAHADAFLGLDDLRGWTLHGSIQKSIPIYATQDTYDEIARCFPYLADRSKATGGGDVPAFEWHIITPLVPLHLFGIEIVPLPVHHGKIFSDPPRPYLSLGFMFDREIVYISDVSYIPEETWQVLEGPSTFQNSDAPRTNEVLGSFSLPSEPPRRRPTLLILDTLRSTTFTSHFGIGEAISTIRRLKPLRTYLIGFAHGTSHSTWVRTCSLISSGQISPSQRSLVIPSESKPNDEPQGLPCPPPIGPCPNSIHLLPPPSQSWLAISGTLHKGLEDPLVHSEWALSIIDAFEPSKKGVKCWVRPGADGLVLKVFEEEEEEGGGGRVRDRRVWDGLYDTT
ncbi:BZ3500_MvSof-1268-A1-R1_Chr5-3g08330 [Microbotryum saponariae]|uniref:BZ3500_MvSof-1268-A1-R1_Chr5-3g08330 protein n=1 Tax=Microbotryum saponariae TaxID=289078 RepID=A0A2X0KK40_9BASI|nr:BZ3500_MvSof-1268-A1-R1_Chr5-3g08330 [Microbotryum saponariae]SDA08438.1 BZ3501_MvSof-1269-A2-R1_Chr5-3g08058 [Microbotryum saponariae]